MIEEHEVGLKEKPDYIEMRPEAPGVRAKDFIPILPLLGLRTRGGGGGGGGSAGVSCLKAPGGGCKISQPGGAYNQVFNFGSLQTQGGGQSFWT